jgi:hypothetical protein
LLLYDADNTLVAVRFEEMHALKNSRVATMAVSGSYRKVF